MSWNYRVIRHVHPTEEKGCWYAIHEVYYNDDFEITAVSVDPIAPVGDSEVELRKDLEMMKLAFLKPVLDHDKIEFAELTIEEAEEIDGDE